MRRGFGVVAYYMRAYRRAFTLLIISGLALAFLNALTPYLIGRLIDVILDPATITFSILPELPLWVFFLGLWGLASIILVFLGWYVDLKGLALSVDIDAAYITSRVSRLLKLPVSFHKSQKGGEIWDKIGQARQSLTNILEDFIVGIAPQILSVLFGLGFVIYIKPLLALILISGIIIFVLLLSRVAPKLGKWRKKSHEAWGRAWGALHNALSNFQAIKHNTAEAYVGIHIIAKKMRAATGKWFYIEKLWQGMSLAQGMVAFATQFFIFLVSILLIQRGDLTVGELIAVNAYAGMVFGPFARLGNQWAVLQKGYLALDRAERMFTLPAEKYQGANLMALTQYKGEITFEDVCFRYDRKSPEVLKEISFNAKPGMRIALVGESGVGKSTTIELISGYYYPTKGKVLIDGIDIRKIGLASLRKYIAVVPQEPVLFNDTILANLKFGNHKAALSEIEEAVRQAHASTFIDNFPKKYKQIVGERGIKLSVGQKQRIAIARAILRDPKILILDEPTSALDAKTERYISESLEHLMKGRTTFIIAHRLSTVRKADLILVFDKGVIVEMGRHEELITIEGGVYRHLYEYQVGLHT